MPIKHAHMGPLYSLLQILRRVHMGYPYWSHMEAQNRSYLGSIYYEVTCLLLTVDALPLWYKPMANTYLYCFIPEKNKHVFRTFYCLAYVTLAAISLLLFFI